MGPLLDEIIEKMGHKMEGKSKLKLALYGGHDTTLIPLMGLIS